MKRYCVTIDKGNGRPFALNVKADTEADAVHLAERTTHGKAVLVRAGWLPRHYQTPEEHKPPIPPT